jgi:hypothetical protein
MQNVRDAACPIFHLGVMLGGRWPWNTVTEEGTKFGFCKMHRRSETPTQCKGMMTEAPGTVITLCIRA